MVRVLLEIDNCCFYFPDKDGNYQLIEIKDGIAHCGRYWKEVKLYSDGFTDLISVCEKLVNPCKSEFYE